MIRVVTAIIAAAMITAAAAQPQQQPYAAPDQELWMAMVQGLEGVSMPATAHQQVRQILQNVQQESFTRAMKAKAQDEAREKKAQEKVKR